MDTETVHPKQEAPDHDHDNVTIVNHHQGVHEHPHHKRQQSSPPLSSDNVENSSLSNSRGGRRSGEGALPSQPQVTSTAGSGAGGRLRRKRSLEDKVCRICGDKALAHNFDVITCESCKAFFRRNALRREEVRTTRGWWRWWWW